MEPALPTQPCAPGRDSATRSVAQSCDVLQLLDVLDLISPATQGLDRAPLTKSSQPTHHQFSHGADLFRCRLMRCAEGDARSTRLRGTREQQSSQAAQCRVLSRPTTHEAHAPLEHQLDALRRRAGQVQHFVAIVPALDARVKQRQACRLGYDAMEPRMARKSHRDFGPCAPAGAHLPFSVRDVRSARCDIDS